MLKLWTHAKKNSVKIKTNICLFLSRAGEYFHVNKRYHFINILHKDTSFTQKQRQSYLSKGNISPSCLILFNHKYHLMYHNQHDCRGWASSLTSRQGIKTSTPSPSGLMQVCSMVSRDLAAEKDFGSESKNARFQQNESSHRERQYSKYWNTCDHYYKETIKIYCHSKSAQRTTITNHPEWCINTEHQAHSPYILEESLRKETIFKWHLAYITSNSIFRG